MRTVTPPAITVAPVEDLPGGARGQFWIQLWTSIALVIACTIVVRPLGFTGMNGVVLVLLAVNSIFLLGRLLPSGWISGAVELALLCCWAVVAAALLCLRSDGLAAAFAYFAAGHAGYRLSASRALGVAGLTGALAAFGLRIAQTHQLTDWPWALGFTVALPVFMGMANRSRDLAVRSALEAATSARRAAASEARAQTLAERARIARDIHDVLAHSLSGVSMQLELSEMLLDDGDPARARDAIGRAHSIVREGMTEAGRAVTALRAGTLPLAQTLTAQFSGAGEVTVVGEPQELETEAGQTLIRAAQEALTNARRYAAGAPLEVRLFFRAAEVELQVSNGPATRPVVAVRTGSGMGLVGMRERAALQGGQVAAGPILDGPCAGGWQVRVTLPTTGAHR